MIWARLFLVVEGILFALAGAWSVLGPFEGGNDAGRAYVSSGGPAHDALADITLTGAATGN